jgi:uncharacterized repeat protein (TIGR01451 family)
LNRRELGTGPSRGFVLLSVFLMMSLGVTALWVAATPRYVGSSSPLATAPFTGQSSPLAPVKSSDFRALFAAAPLAFEANLGQTDSRVKFVTRGSGYGLFLTAEEAVLKVQHSGSRSDKAAFESVIQMKLSHANPQAEVSGEDRLPGKSNYLIGNNPSRWRTNVPQFARVHYRNVYPGIDLVYYGHQGSLEYDFVVTPGSDPRNVVLSFAGANQLQLNAAGDLVLSVPAGAIALHAPRVYQKFGSEEQPVEGEFVLLTQNEVGFQIGDYDRSRELIIDPVLTYSTYLGGTATEGCVTVSGTTILNCPKIAVDNGFDFYVAGSTTSTDFPLTPGTTVLPFQNALKGFTDVFVTKFNTSGSAIVFSTYLGGSGTDSSAGIAVDSGFNVYVAGTTDSSNFPVTSNTAYQTAPKSTGNHVFVSQLQSDGASLLYSSYLSGTGIDIATGVAVDNRLNVFVTGTTTSKDFPVAPSPGALQSKSLANVQFFASEISTSSSLTGLQSLVYSTYFGGGSPATTGVAVGGGIAVDASGNFYITGGTNFAHTGNPATDFPILNAFQSTLLGTTDAFVAKINPTAAPGSQLLYSTYLGGTGDDVGNAIAVDAAFNAYLTGSTTSTDVLLPTSIVAFQSQNNGGTDAFVAKIGNPVSGSTVFPLNYFSYLGGSGTDIGLSVAVDSVQAVHVTGSTTSTNLLVANAVQAANGGGTDAFIAQLSTTTSTGTGTQGQFFSYLGGTGEDRGTGIAVDPNGITYLTGETSSPNFPVANAFQGALKGTSDAFVTKIGAVSSLKITATVSPNPVGLGNQASFTYTITNTGPDTASGVTVSSVLPVTGATFTSATASPGSCTSAAAGAVTCAVGSLNINATATVTVVLTPTSAVPLGNSATVSANGTVSQSASITVPVTDFAVSVAPSSTTVIAGQPASFTVTATPQPTYSASISLSCSAGLPVGATCAFTTNPLTTTNSSAAATSLVINTTARVTTTTELWHRSGFGYGTWLPIAGVALLGLGVGGKGSRQRRAAGGLIFMVVLALLLLLPSCSSTKTATTTTGTPAGTYPITISGASGSASHTSTLTLIVQ